MNKMSENINFDNQWNYIICSKMKNKDVKTTEDMESELQDNKILWDKNNQMNFRARVSGILSDLADEATLKSDKIKNYNEYSKGKKFNENMDKYAKDVIAQLDLKDDGDGLICKDHSKVIMTDEQLEELWESYGGCNEAEQNPADIAAGMREYYSEKGNKK